MKTSLPLNTLTIAMKKFSLTIGFLIFIILPVLKAQSNLYSESDNINTQDDSEINHQHPLESLKVIYDGMLFEELQERAEAYFDKHGRGKGSGYKQYMRWETMRSFECDQEGRLYTNTGFKKYAAISKEERIRIKDKDKRNSSNPGDMTWTALAPTSYTPIGASGGGIGLGRVNTIEFHPEDSEILFAGAPGGGVWKSIDAGITWTPMMDKTAHIGVQDIAVHPFNPDTMYIMTGDGDMEHTLSFGILKTYDGGITWDSTGLIFPHNSVRGFRIALHPTKPDTMFATFVNGGKGIQRSLDGGDTWTQVKSGNYYDFEYKPDNPSTVYATDYNKVYRSTDLGDTWTQVTNGLPSSAVRVELAVTPAEPDYVYALYGGSNAYGSGTYKGLFRSTDAAVSFDTMSTTPNILQSNISYRCLALAAHPLNADSIIAGSYRLWHSGDGGINFSSANDTGSPSGSNYVHVDIHELKYQPGTNRIYCSNDGGVWVSEDNAETWTDLTIGMQTAEYYRIASSANHPDNVVGGLQDIGSFYWTGNGSDANHLYGGDGMDCMVDPDDPNIIYYSVHNGSMFRSMDGGNSIDQNIKPPGATGGWLMPWKMNPLNKHTLIAGYKNGVYRSTDRGSSWQNLGVRANKHLAISPADTNRLYAIFSKEMYTTSDLGVTWDTIPNGGSPNSTVSSLCVDPYDASTLYVTYGGNISSGKIFKSTDAGQTWTDYTATGLPALPIYSSAIQIDSNNIEKGIYLGTEVGIYYRNLITGTSWEYVSQNLPNCPVYDLDINYTNFTLRAGTYGRGLWESPLYGADCGSAPTALCQDITVELDESGTANILPSDVDAGSFGNCGLESMSLNLDSFECPDIGANTVTLTIVDYNSNQEACTAIVTIQPSASSQAQVQRNCNAIVH